MKLHRIYAIILRFLFLFKHSFDRLTDVFYWPTIDLVVWGLTSSYLKGLIPSNTPVIFIIISGIVLWYIVWRAQYELTVNLLEDLWDKNLINIFVSPLNFKEWVASLVILGAFKAFISLLFTAFIAFILYKIQIFSYGLYLIPFFALLLMTGWAVGFFVTGLILRYGTRIQTLAWAMIAVISPFCAVYYPVTVLPDWAQKISVIIPATYVFEGMRQIINTHTMNFQNLYISLVLNIIYIILAIIFLRKSFNRVLRNGLINNE